jgi:hypothetical protein
MMMGKIMGRVLLLVIDALMQPKLMLLVIVMMLMMKLVSTDGVALMDVPLRMRVTTVHWQAMLVAE